MFYVKIIHEVNPKYSEYITENRLQIGSVAENSVHNEVAQRLQNLYIHIAFYKSTFTSVVVKNYVQTCS